MATLAELVQDLPAELYNNILEYTLTTDDEEVTIDANYKPPKQLQISRATRAAVMKAYYSHCRFFKPLHEPMSLLGPWLDSLAPHALTNVRTLRYELKSYTVDQYESKLLYDFVKRYVLQDCRSRTRATLLRGLEHVFYFQVIRSNRNEWVSLEEMRCGVGDPEFREAGIEPV